MLSVIFVFKTNSSDGDCAEVNFFPHTLHAVVADLVWIKIAAVTFTTAITDLSVVKQTLAGFPYFYRLLIDYIIERKFVQTTNNCLIFCHICAIL